MIHGEEEVSGWLSAFRNGWICSHKYIRLDNMQWTSLIYGFLHASEKGLVGAKIMYLLVIPVVVGKLHNQDNNVK